MVDDSLKLFSLYCNKEGRVIDVVNDAFHLLPDSITGEMLFSLVIPSDLKKAFNFLLELNTRGTAVGWELNLNTNKGLETFTFCGGLFEERIGISAATVKSDAQMLFDEMIRINNEQTNMIRSMTKENGPKNSLPEDPAVNYYEELSRLNNQLLNIQRELSKKNRELDELNNLKNHFLGMAAHDLRNPLGVIMGYSSFLIEESEGKMNEEQMDMLQSILSSSEFMLRLLNDLLDISAIESGKFKLELAEYDLVEIVNKNVVLNNVIANKKNITIDFRCDKSIPGILLDRSKIEQVLNNLISNAVKFSPSGTAVMVSITLKENFVVVEVADKGQGIPEGEIDNLFKPFEKTSVKSTGGEKSTGLGLSIVRNLVHGHKGDIWVKSKIGEGSSFFFSLPVL